MIHATDFFELNNSCRQDTYVNQNNIQYIRQGCRPHTTDKGNTDKGDGADNHTCVEIKDIRQDSVQNTATRNILQTDDYQLNNNLAENAQDYRALGMMAFDKLGDSRNVLFTVLFSHEQAHNNRAQSPGNRIPAGTQTNAESMLGNADSRRTADSQTDNSNTNQRRRKSASRKSEVFIVSFTTFFCIPADSEQSNNVQY